MAGTASSPSANTPKVMSSPLTTMKFMQRAAATAVQNSPEDSQGHHLSGDDADLSSPSTKRRKLNGNQTAGNTNGKAFEVPMGSGRSKQTEKTRDSETTENEGTGDQALKTSSPEMKETEWVLSAGNNQPKIEPALKIQKAGFAELDSAENLYSGNGRMTFGKKAELVESKLGSDGKEATSDEDSRGKKPSSLPQVRLSSLSAISGGAKRQLGQKF